VHTFSEINTRFNNLSELHGSASFALHTYQDLDSQLVAKTVRAVFDLVDLSADTFRDYRKALASAYNASRALVGSSEEWASFWNELANLIEDLSASQMKPYLSAEATAAVNSLIEACRTIGAEEPKLNAALESLLKVAPNSAVVLDPRISDTFPMVYNYIESLDLPEVELHVGARAFLSEGLKETSNVVFLTPINTLSERQLRTLLYGGHSASIQFVSPNWQSQQTRSVIARDMFAGLESKSISLRETGAVGTGTTSSKDYVLDEYVFQGKFDDDGVIEDLVTLAAGDDSGIECQLALLTDGYVLPIELDASKVSILEERSDGSLQVVRREKDLLESGDLIVEMVGSNASEYLWQATAVRLGGKTWGAFLTSRKAWRSKLEFKIKHYGQREIINSYRKDGIGASSQIPEWLSNETFVRPRKNEHFAKLIQNLGFVDAEASAIQRLANEVRNARQAVATSIAAALPDEIEAAEFEAAKSGKPIFVEIEVSGGARYLIARFERFEVKTINCLPSQVRQIVRRSQ
jgi:hypothetical protein